MKPPASTAWENGPTGGESSGEVIVVLLMEDSCGQWVRLPDRLDGSGTFETRNKGKRLRVVASAVIDIDVVDPPLPGAGAPDPTRAHRPRSVSRPEPRGRQSAEFESHKASGLPQKHKLLTLYKWRTHNSTTSLLSQ